MEFENLDRDYVTTEPVMREGKERVFNEIKQLFRNTLPFTAVGGLTYLYTKDVKKALAFGIGAYFVYYIGLMRSFK